MLSRSGFRSILFSSNQSTLVRRCLFPQHTPTQMILGNSRNFSIQKGRQSTIINSSFLQTSRREMATDEDLNKIMNKDDLTQQKAVKLPNKEIISILNAFRNITYSQPFKSKLEELSKKNIDLVSKWQLMVQLLVQAKEVVVTKHGLRSVDEFKSALSHAISTREGSEILNIHRENWDDWISRVFPREDFNFSVEPPIPKVKMLRIIDRLFEEITSKEFAEDVGEMLKTKDLSVGEKGRDLIFKVSTLHRSIMEKYGFKGEKGYIECQRSLVIHFFSDPDITKLSRDVSQVVFNFTTKMIAPSDNVY